MTQFRLQLLLVEKHMHVPKQQQHLLDCTINFKRSVPVHPK